MTCDLLVIGGGPAGFAAALQGAALGLSTVLVEKGELGGTCLNVGCIPTKLHLGATEAVDELAAQKRLRLAAGEVHPDLAAMLARKDRFLAATRKAMQGKLEAAGVTWRRGTARFDAENAVEIVDESGSHVLTFETAILATGSEVVPLPGLPTDGEKILDSAQALALSAPPPRLAIVGGGFIGLEMGQIFHRLGSKITLVEALDRPAAAEDPEVSAELVRSFKRAGWTMKFNTKVTGHEKTDDGLSLTLDSGETVAADACLVVVGRRPAAKGLAVEAAGARLTPRGAVAVDAHLKAGPRLYAIGDVNGRTMLAHAAEHQASYVVGHIAGRNDHAYVDAGLPSIIYGAPEVVRVGSPAAELKSLGQPVEVSRAPLIANAIAQAHGATAGFVKVAWVGERIRGVTAVGHQVSRLATLAEVMVRQGWTRRHVEDLIFPHPMLDEALLEAVRAKREEV